LAGARSGLYDFTLHDVHHHALTVDVRDSEGASFEQAQAAGVDGQETNPVTREAHTSENATNFSEGEYDRHAFFPPGAHELQGRPVPFDGVFEEKLDAAQRNGAGSARPFFDVFDVEEVVAQVFFGDLVGRFAAVLGEFTHGADVHLLRAFGIAAQLQILQHALSKLGHNIPP